MSRILWEPDPARAAATHLARLQARTGHADYASLHRWSIDDLAGFWAEVWDDCEVIASVPYDRVHGPLAMPGTTWFPGARLNFAQNLLRRHDQGPGSSSPQGGSDIGVALIGAGEEVDDEVVTFADLRRRVAGLQAGFATLGVGVGDVVAALVPNVVATVECMLAAVASGATWTSCSPDFGAPGVVDRFGQVAPAVLVVADGYRYGGKVFGLQDKVAAVVAAIPSLRHIVVIDVVGVDLGQLPAGVAVHRLADLRLDAGSEPDFVQLPADHPLYVMYSSGTTGVPKSIVHGAGGTLLTHLKEHRYHGDLHPGDVITWFTTCGWMMWNWLVSALGVGATVVLSDGSPFAPDAGSLWRLAERTGVTHFGTSPKYLAALQKGGHRPSSLADLSRIRAVLSTGSPLNPEQFDWVYEAIAPDVQLASVSGGTDLIGCFVGGAPTLPVRRGELQCRTLGMAVEAWDETGTSVVGTKGELVCVRPFPSMPVGFWGDPDGSRYRATYFAAHPGVWTHGDFIELRPEGGVVIYGRSDTTLNPGGVRIGTAEIYRAIEALPQVVDAVVVGRPVGGDVEVVLCVALADGIDLDDGLVDLVRRTIRAATTPRHVPAHVFAVREIPYTISGKKVEKAVAAMLVGDPVDNRDALANPAALDEYATLFPR